MEDLLVGSLSSIPRWRFARKLEGRGDEPNDKRVPDAMEALSKSTKDVLDGSNVVVEFLINREPCAERIRLKLYAALTRSMLYMEKKDFVICEGLFDPCFLPPTLSWDVSAIQHCSDNYMTWNLRFPNINYQGCGKLGFYVLFYSVSIVAPTFKVFGAYRSPLWSVLRGEKPGGSLRDPLGKRSCDWSSGMEVKVHRELSKLDDVDRLAAVDSIAKCVSVARKCFSSKGGSHNVKVESIMSHMAQ